MEKDKEFTVARLILRMANQIVTNRNLHVKALGLTTARTTSASPTRPPGASSSAWRGKGW